MNLSELGLDRRFRTRKPCPSCGTMMTMGSGYFSTDYLCPNCGREFNSALQRLSSHSQWGEETGEAF